MRAGVIFPQTEIGNDPGSIATYARAAEDLGFDHIVAYDHVLSAHPDRFPNGDAIYTTEHPFHEVFVLLGYLAGQTTTIELSTGILILPQRQTVLVAKQAASLDVLSGGRLRLGVGIGWNHVEFEGLGEDFSTRGARVSEQIELLRRLWTEPVVTFTGAHHTIDRAGLNPMPVQRPIPVWIGAWADVAVDRAARLGDGWFSHVTPDERGRALVERFRARAREAGRNPGVEAWMQLRHEDRWPEAFEAYRDMGITHVSLNTMRAGLKTPDEHVAAITRFATLVQRYAAA